MQDIPYIVFNNVQYNPNNITKFEKQNEKNLRFNTEDYDEVFPNNRYVHSTSYDDIVEPSLYEKMRIAELEGAEEDIYRENELYSLDSDYKGYLYSQYSHDDVPLAHQYRVPEGIQNDFADYYPDTNIDKSIQRKLIHINLIENVIPNCFDKDTKTGLDGYTPFADLATYELEDGVSLPTIKEALKKSVLKNGRGKSYTASVDLFQYLLAHPKDRNIVIGKDNSGKEIFDQTASVYYPIFQKMFPTNEDAQKALKGCRTHSEDGFTVNPQLCDLVTIMRRKSNNNEGYSGVKYTKETQWSEKDSELLDNLVSDDMTLKENLYKDVRKMFKKGNITVDEVLENIQNRR